MISRTFSRREPLSSPLFDVLILYLCQSLSSKALSPKALEAALPSPVTIGPKTFSLVPNLHTQEGMVICMLKPFAYKDSHRVPWKYDVILISA